MTGSKIKTDRRVLKTKKAIHQAFLSLFYSKDMENITINEIADLADVNRGTVYLHYTDKYDLLDKMIEEHIDQMIGYCDPDGQTGLLSELIPLFNYLKEHHLFFKAMFTTHKSVVFRKRMIQVISTNLRNKLDKKKGSSREISNELSALFMSSAFIGIIEWWVEQGMPHPPEYMATQVEKLFEKNEV